MKDAWISDKNLFHMFIYGPKSPVDRGLFYGVSSS